MNGFVIRYKDAQELLESIVSVLQIELTLRFNHNDEVNDNSTFIPRVQKTVRFLKENDKNANLCVIGEINVHGSFA